MKMRLFFKYLAMLSISLSVTVEAVYAEEKQAKILFGSEELPAKMPAQAYGFYTKGCLAGGVAMPIDGPTWQAMRLERNRRWGHPELITLLQKLSFEGAQYDGWPGLLVGDISQPRGGPMLSGHTSHQVGLDADIWFTPMPDRKLSFKERMHTSAISMLKSGTLEVDPQKWTNAHANIVMRAASYPNVERIFVHPGIKKELCTNFEGDSTYLGKVRPYYGHHYHFHIRIKCPEGSIGCKSQAPVPEGSGCGAPLDWWFEPARWAPPKPKKPADPNAKPPPPKFKTMADLPSACQLVLDAKRPASEAEVTLGEMIISDVQLNYTGRPEFDEIKDVPLPILR